MHFTSWWLLAGIAQWAALQLRGELAKVAKHLLADSFDLVKGLTGQHYPTNSYFMKVDIKDFYLSGSIYDIHQDSIDILEPGPRKDLVSEIILFILTSQYVELPKQ
ncbi:MAG: hypothetical protein ACKPKO_58245, partial [Candidatus Fonsibacter sp.]